MKTTFTNNSSMKIRVVSDKPTITTTDYNTQHLERQLDVIESTEQELFNNPFDEDALITQSPESWVQHNMLTTIPDYWRRRWFHFNDYENHGLSVFETVMKNQFTGYDTPFVSFVTSVHNSKFLKELYKSLVEQTLNDWEWIIVDDSEESMETEIRNLIKNDIRCHYYRISEQTFGNIGLAKWRASCFATGKWIFELDHDDELYPWTTQTLYDASQSYPDSRFMYSDFVDISEQSEIIKNQYGTEYAFGYGHSYSGRFEDSTTYTANESPNINSATIRHIVGMPNHFRCWRKDLYFEIGGHNKTQRIADDYELCCRTFLSTRMTHIKFPCYKQRFYSNNSQDPNRRDIQRRVYVISKFYNHLFHETICNLYGQDSEKFFSDNIDEMLEYYSNKGNTIPIFNYIYIH